MLGDDRESAVDERVPQADAASPKLKWTFWGLVILLKVAVIATAIGALLLVFQNDLRLGGALLGLGAITFVVWVRRVRQVKSRLASDGGFEDATSQ